jgi:hypothetical protein
MIFRRQAVFETALSLAFVSAAGCHGSAATLSSSGVPALSGTAVTGGPTSYTVDFGQVAVGDQREATLSLTNSGSSPLLITSIGAPSDPEFTCDLASGTNIEAGSSVAVTCTFKPFGPGQKTGTLAIGTDSESIPTLTLDLTGEGVPVTFKVDPRVLDFGTVVVHSTVAKSITLINQSALDLTVTQSAVTGNNASLFTNPAGANSFTLPANQSVTVDFTYQPVIPSKLDTATITFTPSIGEPIIATLQAIAVESGLVITPDPVDFNFVQPGDMPTITLRIKNVGNQNVNVGQVAITDPGGGAFTIVPGTITQATPLAPATELDIPVQFSPIYQQHSQGEISVDSNDNLAERVIALQGWGGGAAIQCKPLALDFGIVAVGISPSLPLLCTNTGSEIANHPETDLVIEQLPTSNAAFSASVDTTSLTVLSAGQTALIDVSYLPSGPTHDSAKLTVLSNVTSAPAPVIQLSGDGIDVGPCNYAITPSSLDWGAVSGADKSLQRTEAVTIANVGTNVCVLDALRLTDSDTGAFTLPGGGLTGQLIAAPGQPPSADGGALPTSITVPVAFAALRGQGSYAGQLSFTISDPGGPNQVVNLAAQAVDSCFLLQPDQLDLGTAGLIGNDQFCQKNRKQLVGVNDCAGVVTITGIGLSGGEPFDQVGGPTLPVQVPPGGVSPAFVFGFTPAASGEYYGLVKVQTDLLATPLGATLHGRAISGTEKTDVFSGNTAPAVDILWVVDTDDLGGEFSFAPPNPLDSLSQFVSAAQGVDYQMAVLTDDCPAFGNGSFEPCPGCFNDGMAATIVNPSMANPGKTLTDLIGTIASSAGTGTCNGNYNATMLSAWNGLQPNILAGHNAGFLRDNAALAVIVYDPDGYAEDEGSPQMPDYYLNYFGSLKGGDSQLISVSVMYMNVFGNFPAGRRYSALVGPSGGLMLDSTAANWANDVTKLWAAIASGNGGFALSGTPIPDTIQIWLDGPPPGPGVTMPGLQILETNPNGTTNWTFVPSSNSVVFNSQNYTIGASDTVTVVYSLACE